MAAKDAPAACAVLGTKRDPGCAGRARRVFARAGALRYHQLGGVRHRGGATLVRFRVHTRLGTGTTTMGVVESGGRWFVTGLDD